MWITDTPIFIFITGVISIYFAYVLVKRFYTTSPSQQKGRYFETKDGLFRFPHISEKSSVDLSVIVPAYNEEDRLPTMLDETLGYLEKRQTHHDEFKYEIIVIDDGSKDKTYEVALKYSKKYGCEKIRVLKLTENLGKGGAVQQGMVSGRGEYLLMVDADGATQFSDLQKLEAKMKQLHKEPNSRAIVVGSRAHLEEDSIAKRSFFRTLLMKGFHLIVWLLCVRSVKDSQCGFKLFTREAAYVTFLNLHVMRWAFDVELLYIAEELGVSIAEVAVKWTEIDGSKIIPVFSWIQMGKDILLIWLHHRLKIWRIKKEVE